MGMAVGTKENAEFKQLKAKWLGHEKKATLHCEIMRRLYGMYRLKFLHAGRPYKIFLHRLLPPYAQGALLCERCDVGFSELEYHKISPVLSGVPCKNRAQEYYGPSKMLLFRGEPLMLD